MDVPGEARARAVDPGQILDRPGRRRRRLPVPRARRDLRRPRNFQVGLWWLAGFYLIHSVAELCISPVGLSMITKLSIARVVGMMMGVWFLSISVAQYVAGIVAQFASVETVGGQVTNLKVSLNTYTGNLHDDRLDRDRRRRRVVPSFLAAPEVDARRKITARQYCA